MNTIKMSRNGVKFNANADSAEVVYRPGALPHRGVPAITIGCTKAIVLPFHLELAIASPGRGPSWLQR